MQTTLLTLLYHNKIFFDKKLISSFGLDSLRYTDIKTRQEHLIEDGAEPADNNHEFNFDSLLEYCFSKLQDSVLSISEESYSKLDIKTKESLCNTLGISVPKKQTEFKNIVDISRAQITKPKKKYHKLGFSKIDEVFNNVGLPEGTFNVIVAESNAGKTTFLCNLAYNYAKQGLRVGYITFEETEDDITNRIIQNILSVSKSHVLNNLDTIHQSIAYHRDVDIFKRIFVEAKDPSTCSVSEYLTTHNTDCFDILLIDYQTHFEKDLKKDIHTEEQRIAIELATYAKNNPITIWTGAQINRSGYKKTDVGMENIGSSLGTVKIANNVFILILETSSDFDNIKNNETDAIVSFFIDKNREGVNKQKVFNCLNKTNQRFESPKQENTIEQQKPRAVPAKVVKR